MAINRFLYDVLNGAFSTWISFTINFRICNWLPHLLTDSKMAYHMTYQLSTAKTSSSLLVKNTFMLEHCKWLVIAREIKMEFLSVYPLGVISFFIHSTCSIYIYIYFSQKVFSHVLKTFCSSACSFIFKY